MAEIQVNYTVELGVWVDTDEGEVKHVLIGNIDLDENEPTVPKNRELGYPDEVIYKAIDIANNMEWPVWK